MRENDDQSLLGGIVQLDNTYFGNGDAGAGQQVGMKMIVEKRIQIQGDISTVRAAYKAADHCYHRQFGLLPANFQ
ncbi:MAG: hypothetical protein ACJA13_000269 [Paraglaciecola sp.]|jgi:hypothetical protein